ncbi:penicillin-binding protein [Patescibacteria group bacterium]|nr:MAG: penicillin-binding protein [Patescibacteria group bacterium]
MRRSLTSAVFSQRRRDTVILAAAILLLLVGLSFVWVASLELPTLSAVRERKVSESTKIYDRTGKTLLYDVNQNVKRTVIPFEEISRHIKNATIAIEDREFYEHRGVKPRSMLRALLKNTSTLQFSQGGSTITQQVVKNSLLSGEKKVTRKIKEIVLALKLERTLSKDEILSLYLNEIPYGGSIYGAEEASQTFFGKSAAEVDLAEAAYLAALPKAPTFYSPYGVHRDKLEERKNLVLDLMQQYSFISEEEYRAARKEQVFFQPKKSSSIKAPHFIFFVLDYLERRYGENLLQNGGLRVKTTLDYNIQEKAEDIARRNALANKEKFNAENAAFVVIDPKTGDIFSMVGSRDYFDNEIDGNFNIATAYRQPGSTFKPFVYSTAFLKGYTPETVLFDLPTQFAAECAPDNFDSENNCYAPSNYDNRNRGPITLRESLAQSINITSVKTLYLAGVRDSIALARQMGISTLEDPNRYGLTLVLGGGEVSLLDLTSAYSVFANGGVRNPYRSVLEVTDKDGVILEQSELRPSGVLSPEIASTISDILSDNVARAPAFGETSYLYIPSRQVAVKTGTTNDYRDAWIIGYTPSIAIGAWAGNNDNSPMEKKVAGFIVAPMWRELMDQILPLLPNEAFPTPSREDSFELKPVLRGRWEGGTSHLIDTVSGKFATRYTPKETTKELLSGGVYSILYWVDKDNPRGVQPARPENDSQFRLWEYGVQKWVADNNKFQPVEITLPQGLDDVHTPENAPKVSISIPSDTFSSSDQIVARVSAAGRYPLRKAEYFVNGAFVGESSVSPFSFTLNPADLDFLGENNTLRVVVTDSVYNRGEAEKTFHLIPSETLPNI